MLSTLYHDIEYMLTVSWSVIIIGIAQASATARSSAKSL